MNAMRRLRAVARPSCRAIQATTSAGDLIQEGNLGHVTAVKRSDWRRGLKFSTCAMWSMHQAFAEAVINRDRPILVSVRTHWDAVPCSFSEIGEALGRTAVRLDQLEKIALRRQGHPSFGLRESDIT